jgi:putative signal transducing protein
MSTKPQGDPELVEVFDTQQESEAMVVHSLLESAGIESVISNLDAPQDVLPGVGGVVVRVNPEDAEEARRIIEEYRNSPAAEEVEETEGDDEIVA